MKDYYFVSYTWRNLGSNQLKVGNILIDIHPLQWISEQTHDTEEYRLLSWQGIGKYEYDLYKDNIN